MAANREKLVRNAEKLVSRGKIEAAIREYRKLLVDQPKDTNTLNRVGDLYARIQRIDEAVRLFRQIASQYTEEGFFVKAIAIYKKIIKLDPTRLSVYERLAELYHRQGLINEARTQYQVLADYYVKQDNSASASSIYQRMADLEPEDPSHRAKLAELYQQQRLLDKALEQYGIIADIMLSHEQAEQAEQVLLRALDVHPEDLAFVRSGIERLRSADEHEAALRFARAAAERNEKAAPLVEELEGPLAPPSADDTAKDAEPHEIVLDRPEDFLADDAELMQALREADAAVGEAPPAAAGAGDDLDFGWDEEESESLVRPPADLADQPDVTGSGFELEESAFGLPALEGDSQTFELDLADLVAEAPDAAEGEVEQAIEEGIEGIEPEPAPREAIEPSPHDDFLSEAEVLAKYGLHEKALERVRQVLVSRPQNQRAHRLAVQLHLDDGDDAAALEVAARLGDLPGGREGEAWELVAALLSDAGLELPSPAAAVEEPAESQEPESVAIELDDLELGDLELGEQSVAQEVRAAETEPPPADEAAAYQEAPAEPYVPDLDLGDLVEWRAEDGAVPATPVEPSPELAERPADAESAPETEPAESEDAAEGAAEAEPAPPAEAEREEAAEEPAAAPQRTPETSRRINRLLESLLDDIPGTVKRRRKHRRDSVVDQLLDVAGVKKKKAPAAAAAQPEAEAGPEAPAETPVPEPAPEIAIAEEAVAAIPGLGEVDGSVEVQIGAPEPEVDPLELDDHSDIEDALSFMQPAPGAIPSSPPPAASPEVLELDETGPGWLDEVSSGEVRTEGQIFEEEESFFDLGAELEEELSVSDAVGTEPAGEQSLEEIVEGFKQGVAEQLSPEDYDTHFDLGIAYREMGLIDEAIGEFQVAAKAPQHLVQCCSMLGICFLEKGLPELAIKWYSRGLQAPQISEEDSLALLYDLGEVYLSTGDTASAHQAFVEVYGLNTNFRDIAAKVAETQPS